MDKMKFESPNLTAKNVAKLAELFPGVVAEGKVNIDLLRSYVGEEVFADEAYEFTWVGKRAAIAEAGRPIRKTLRPCVDESKDWDTTENLYIEGDNLDVLKLLQESYLGKVKMIYIDPPYNNGDLIACFDERISEKAIREIAERKPLRAVFCDSSFTSSPEKINVFEIFKLLAPNTNVRVI